MTDRVTKAIDGGDLKTAVAGAAKVVVVDGPDEGLEVPIARGAVEIGSGAKCELRLTDPAVSRRHATITSDGTRLKVIDRGSRNGTFLGGTKIVEADVQLGSVLRVGNSTVALQPRYYMREVAPSSSDHFGELIGESVSMREAFAIFERVAPTDVTVLVEGESGTGKELAARSIHAASLRADKPYVVFDCAAVPAELAESELFGHVKGAFSGAVADRLGAFQRADGGTICLDEIGELPLELQPKLLRVLETSEIRAVGDDKMRKVDVRVVAATNRNLSAEAHCGRFRPDLVYRLAVVKVRLPALRDHPEDVPILVRHFLADKVQNPSGIGGENLERLGAYSWPGNVRELRNMLTRAVSLANRPGEPPAPFEKLVFNVGPVTGQPATIGPSYPGVATHIPYREARDQMVSTWERAYIEALLDRHDGNVTRAAEAAGVSRKYLYDIIHRAGDAGG